MIYDITFEMFPEVIVETKNITDKTAEQVFCDKRFLKELINNNEYVQIFWLPFTGLSVFYVYSHFVLPLSKEGQNFIDDL